MLFEFENGVIGYNGDGETLTGQGEDDVLFGSLDDDTLIGDSEDDLLAGNDGADDLTGSEGDDYLLGGAGDDALDGGEGENFVDGGEGIDTARYEDAEVLLSTLTASSVELPEGFRPEKPQYTVEHNGEVDILHSIEKLRLGDQNETLRLTEDSTEAVGAPRGNRWG